VDWGHKSTSNDRGTHTLFYYTNTSW